MSTTVSPNRSRSASRDPAAKALNDMKFSITAHDPLERLAPRGGTDAPSDEEQVSDDEKVFDYEIAQEELPNYNPAHVDGVTLIEDEDEKGPSKTEALQMILAYENAISNAKEARSPVDERLVETVRTRKKELTGSDKLNYPNMDAVHLARKDKLDKLRHTTEYTEYKKQITHPNIIRPSQKPKLIDPDMVIPYTSDVENKIDLEIAKKLNDSTRISPVDLNVENARAIQLLTRGDFFQLIDPARKPKSFLVCYDHSEEAKYALDWCIGSVLADGSVLYIVEVIEDDEKLSALTSSDLSRARRRIENCNVIVQYVNRLLSKTRLQIHVVVEVMHHPLPRHLFTQVINHLKPTMVVVGSKGKSALQGVLLGSLSNYLVTNSSVPVMVVRKRLKQLIKRGDDKFPNNIKSMADVEVKRSMV
ncbi:hypothetical protein BABINDRAFT_120483 [Babjeviella inositovora NRRL Y-12698]|uniref:UspA domain-containing protein n=1 Tax=Babjeviella inositovora NRRL Y-12698 TaxID=984486 RepID=A0A1E3QTX2_9ASCO|nr:uncharacterized protein BABINDRAFT_120483 [Babjeviella inositovora NRRL Y-12698]ODQ81133.1 hypothetical protein BABINDRAFT_120483 [Babjeviella inositovora NRRL Y-12698]